MMALLVFKTSNPSRARTDWDSRNDIVTFWLLSKCEGDAEPSFVVLCLRHLLSGLTKKSIFTWNCDVILDFQSCIFIYQLDVAIDSCGRLDLARCQLEIIKQQGDDPLNSRPNRGKVITIYVHSQQQSGFGADCELACCTRGRNYWNVLRRVGGCWEGDMLQVSSQKYFRRKFRRIFWFDKFSYQVQLVLWRKLAVTSSINPYYQNSELD